MSTRPFNLVFCLENMEKRLAEPANFDTDALVIRELLELLDSAGHTLSSIGNEQTASMEHAWDKAVEIGIVLESTPVGGDWLEGVRDFLYEWVNEHGAIWPNIHEETK